MHELSAARRTARRTTAGRRFPADPARVDEIIAVMKAAGGSAYGLRLRALIVILWRAGLRISEALALAETDLEATRGSLVVRRGKGGKRREVGMDDWGWEQLAGWLAFRATLPVGPLLCAVWDAAFSPDGERVVTAGKDGTARIWECGVACDPVGALLESVPQLAGRLSAAERARYLPE